MHLHLAHFYFVVTFPSNAIIFISLKNYLVCHINRRELLERIYDIFSQICVYTCQKGWDCDWSSDEAVLRATYFSRYALANAAISHVNNIITALSVGFFTAGCVP
jgi:hypothetical protein